ncbi:serine/threonine-protein kinase/endoribonuclease IRE1 [Pancytospora philotis]|nr:serine/threonine-protein kinase/endoribonuclease IRE1 [Pancytospora philotis]
MATRFCKRLYCALLATALCEYAIQTTDNMLYLLSERRAGFPIPFGRVQHPDHDMPLAGEQRADQKYRGSDNAAEDRSRIVDGGAAPASAPGRYASAEANALCSLGRPARGLAQLSALQSKGRLDSIRLSDDGCVIYRDYKIPITMLYGTPFLQDNISIMANSLHIPYVIDGIFLAVASIEIVAYDLESYNQRTIRMDYLVHWREESYSYEVDGNRLVIDGTAYTFPAPVLAVFRLEHRGALLYLVRLFNNKLPSALRHFDFARHSAAKRADGALTPAAEKADELAALSNTGICPVLDNDIFDHLYIKNLIDSSHVSSVPALVRKYGSGKEGHVDFDGHHSMSIASLVQLYARHGFFVYVLGHINITVVLLLLVCGLVAYHRRNIKHCRRVAPGIYRAEFLGAPCLVYQVANFRHCYSRPQEKNGRLVDIYSYNRLLFGLALFRKVVVTEETTQYVCPDRARLKEDLLAVARVLEYMHDRNCTLDRLCPENIRVSSNGTVKVQAITDNLGWRPASRILRRAAKTGLQSTVGDVFAFGCVLHYYLTGHHPFDSVSPKKYRARGSTDSSEMPHISSDDASSPSEPAPSAAEAPVPCVHRQVLSDEALKTVLENTRTNSYYIRVSDTETHDLIYHCVFMGNIRISQHPFFWRLDTKLELICDVSDYIDVNPYYRDRVERLKELVFRGRWTDTVDRRILDHVEKKRRYNGMSLVDLMRVIRNSHRHHHEYGNKELYSLLPGGIAEYYTTRFPTLVLCLYKCKHIRSNEVFKRYF